MAVCLLAACLAPRSAPALSLSPAASSLSEGDALSLEVRVQLDKGETLEQVQLGTEFDYQLLQLRRSPWIDQVGISSRKGRGHWLLRFSAPPPPSGEEWPLLLKVVTNQRSHFPVVALKRAARPVAPVAEAPAALSPPLSPPLPGKTYGPIRDGENLTTVARDFLPASRGSIFQAMALIWQYNPERFIGGNMNALKAGSVLIMPPAAEVRAMPENQARQLRDRHREAWLKGEPVSLEMASPKPALPESVAVKPTRPPPEQTPTPEPLEERLTRWMGEMDAWRNQVSQTVNALHTPDASAGEPSWRKEVIGRLDNLEQVTLEQLDRGTPPAAAPLDPTPLEKRLTEIEKKLLPPPADADQRLKRIEERLSQLENRPTLAADGPEVGAGLGWLTLLLTSMATLAGSLWMVRRMVQVSRRERRQTLEGFLNHLARNRPEVLEEALAAVEETPAPYVPPIEERVEVLHAPDTEKKTVVADLSETVNRLDAMLRQGRQATVRQAREATRPSPVFVNGEGSR
ncbi:MAG: hypothetical protein HQL56_02260 [Magnetococcales bacterium]|nr:hypothetical protein [Magnetococcales bacterium]